MPLDARGHVIANPQCAICGQQWPLDNPCAHESVELRNLSQQALHRWLDASAMQQIQKWVFDKASTHIKDKFEKHLERHRRWLESDLARIPYYKTYQDFRGHPPNLRPEVVDAIGRDIYKARSLFQDRINDSWRHCIRKFPKALDRAWSQIRAQYPIDARAIRPPPARRNSFYLWP
ncbi:hypothetical protein K461DRAFT_296770 [Myriangium duriaei CBS 260.36]|uniref:Uncharacterized protein n=1 Tax=Myriangium duriaei CBS 260.36 TaxID=1168546 RepID=A0A9P4MIZ9_9PEZI|nr:hypothetical protein K461DRAFT_296770 [Myriangium duriaei CBS 260.36]